MKGPFVARTAPVGFAVPKDIPKHEEEDGPPIPKEIDPKRRLVSDRVEGGMPLPGTIAGDALLSWIFIPYGLLTRKPHRQDVRPAVPVDVPCIGVEVVRPAGRPVVPLHRLLGAVFPRAHEGLICGVDGVAYLEVRALVPIGA